MLKRNVIQLGLSIAMATLSLEGTAQVQVVNKAIISTKTAVKIIDKEAEPSPTVVFDQWGNAITVLRPDDEKTILSTTYFRGDKLKTEAKINDSTIVHSLRDWGSQTTSTVIEFKKVVYFNQGAVVPQGLQQDTIMPIIHLPRPTLEKSERTVWGPHVYITDAVLEKMQKSVDSTKLANGYDTAQPMPNLRIIYKEEEKKIAGYACKRAVIMVQYPNGETEQVPVWYNTEIKMEGLDATGDPAFAYGYLNPTKKWFLLSGLKGFPMEFEMNLAPNRAVTVTVSRLDIKRKIIDKDVALPVSTQPLAFQDAPQNNHLKADGWQYSMTYSNNQLLPIMVVKRD